MREGDVSTSELTPRTRGENCRHFTTRDARYRRVFRRGGRGRDRAQSARDAKRRAVRADGWENGQSEAADASRARGRRAIRRRRRGRWHTNQRYPCGHLIKVLGAVGDVDCEMAALLARYDIPADAFGAQSLAELPFPARGRKLGRPPRRGRDETTRFTTPQGVFDRSSRMHGRR